tara:strand:- start:32047 stop:33321 length:1275 start_codon:yes stop_codon:yes gene_type:complete
MSMLKTRQTCRICGGPLAEILDLGKHHLVGYVGAEGHEPIKRKVPLVLCRCDTVNNENGCGLVQLRHTTPGKLMYPRYFYRSGINRTMTEHLHGIVEGIHEFFEREESPLEKNDMIIDVGCNDGTSLKYWKSKSYENLFGFDPAKNMLEFSAESGANITTDYFNLENMGRVRAFGAKVITSIAMFYDLEDPNEFVRDIGLALDSKGIWVFEQSYLPSMLSQNAYDTICHEHIEYYSLATIQHLLRKNGMEVVDVHLNDINGGSFQVYAAKRKAFKIQPEAEKRIQSLLEREFELALDSEEPFDAFKERVESNNKQLVDFLKQAKAEGKTVYAYGASTKGAITLQVCGITNELIKGCADRNPMKWGTEIMGTGIPIVSEDEARADKPDYFLALPWHFMEEFKEREQSFRDHGGKWVVPMPEFKVF